MGIENIELVHAGTHIPPLDELFFADRFQIIADISYSDRIDVEGGERWQLDAVKREGVFNINQLSATGTNRFSLGKYTFNNSTFFGGSVVVQPAALPLRGADFEVVVSVGWSFTQPTTGDVISLTDTNTFRMRKDQSMPLICSAITPGKDPIARVHRHLLFQGMITHL